MVDIETHKIIDLINSRKMEDVKEWLETYKNLQIFSRDGSITYKNAITLSHPSVIQVGDRFHLLKNLTGYCIDYLKGKLKSDIVIGEKDNSLSEDSEIITTETQNKY